MTSIQLTVTLPEAVAAKARDLGLLTDEKLAELIEAEVERKRSEAGARLLQIMHELQDASRADFGHMTEEEFMDMVNDIVHEVREEIRAENNEQES